MLVLSRRNGESIVIDGTIIVKIIEVHGQQVRLGIEAPEEVRVLREELLLACEEPVAA
jgi:carbon storage regulator